MGTCNFYGCGRFGLWAVLDEYNEEWYAQEYPDLTEEQRYQVYSDGASDWYYSCAKEMEALLDEFNDTLVFHRLKVNYGYYDGVEIVLGNIHYPDGGTYPSATIRDGDTELAWYVEQMLGMGWYHKENCAKAKHLAKCRAMYEAECEHIMSFLVNGMGRKHMFYPFHHAVGSGWDMSEPFDESDVEELEGMVNRIEKPAVYDVEGLIY